jgi:hypothetical protein
MAAMLPGAIGWANDHGVARPASGATIVLPMQALVKFFRANPQALALLVICLVLGLGTFLAVVLGLMSTGSSTTSGEPSGVLLALHALRG